ncbi:hypothetical protein HGM15179_002396 [Zosterops borbonicus]|uniref:Rna-directed dna polymerase from mobile element jockey-like n=1 Tax=Zosterops borbonicus TaxID=364589 RepID=A0A8K1LSH9_9PASS|nr:hypothetical protein HGM15179_002396 [Zosterops borbonicus]
MTDKARIFKSLKGDNLPQKFGQIQIVSLQRGGMWKWTPKMLDIPQRLVLGWVLFNAFVSDMDSGIEHTFRMFTDDTKLQGADNTLDGRDVTQRDLDSLERWV